MSISDDELEAAILFPIVALRMAELVKKCHGPLGQFARLETERVRQQERANREAVAADEAKERNVELVGLLSAAQPYVGAAADSFGGYGLGHEQADQLHKRIDAALAKDGGGAESPNATRIRK